MLLGLGIGFALGVIITIEMGKDGKATAQVQILDSNESSKGTAGKEMVGKAGEGSSPPSILTDQEPSKGPKTVKIFSLKYKGAAEAGKMIERLFPYDFNIVTDQDKNTLLIAGRPPKIDMVAAILEEIDQPNPDRANRKKEEKDEARVPAEPYTIGPYDVMKIDAIGTLLDQPIKGYYLVEAEGTVALGPAYGRMNVAGLSLAAAEEAIEKKLRDVLANPRVSLTLARNATPPKSGIPPAPHRIAPGDVLDIWANGTL